MTRPPRAPKIGDKIIITHNKSIVEPCNVVITEDVSDIKSDRRVTVSGCVHHPKGKYVYLSWYGRTGYGWVYADRSEDVDSTDPSPDGWFVQTHDGVYKVDQKTAIRISEYIQQESESFEFTGEGEEGLTDVEVTQGESSEVIGITFKPPQSAHLKEQAS